jgi:hypothetical protein
MEAWCGASSTSIRSTIVHYSLTRQKCATTATRTARNASLEERLVAAQPRSLDGPRLLLGRPIGPQRVTLRLNRRLLHCPSIGPVNSASSGCFHRWLPGGNRSPTKRLANAAASSRLAKQNTTKSLSSRCREYVSGVAAASFLPGALRDAASCAEITAGEFTLAASQRRIVRLDLAQALFPDRHIGLTKNPQSLTIIRG